MQGSDDGVACPEVGESSPVEIEREDAADLIAGRSQQRVRDPPTAGPRDQAVYVPVTLADANANSLPTRLLDREGQEELGLVAGGGAGRERAGEARPTPVSEKLPCGVSVKAALTAVVQSDRVSVGVAEAECAAKRAVEWIGRDWYVRTREFVVQRLRVVGLQPQRDAGSRRNGVEVKPGSGLADAERDRLCREDDGAGRRLRRGGPRGAVRGFAQ